MASIEEDEDIGRLFPKCRIRSPKKETAALIDLSDENKSQNNAPVSFSKDPDSDSEEVRSPVNSYLHFGQMQQRRVVTKCRLENVDNRRKFPRPRTLETLPRAYDTYGGGYEPSPDSEDNDSDRIYYKLPQKKSGVRQSSSESHIVGHWRKHDPYHYRHRSASKEVYDLTPTRPEGSSTGGESRLEIAGGREILSRSRVRPQRKRHAVHTNNNSTATSSNRSINRYSGEVYYEESMGRYGFHVDGNTLWGSRGLEPSFSIPSSLDEKQNSTHSIKRPLSWAGDGGSDPNNLIANNSSMYEIEVRGDRATPSQELDDSLDNGEFHPSSTSDHKQSNVVHGYLTEFYPEVVTGNQTVINGPCNDQVCDFGDSGGNSLNLDNYSLEQLNQFAQSGKEMAAQDENEVSLTRVIGGITIAQYEGSPRRYGIRSHISGDYSDTSENIASFIANKQELGACTMLPLPGFPRRILSSNDSINLNSYVSDQTFSPSQTRQTLVELTDVSHSPVGNLTVKDVSSPNTLVTNRRNQEASLNIQWNLDVRDTENAEHVKDGDRDTTSTNAETDLGETEVGLVVGQSRNFTLSPETTDYDSELDAQSDHIPQGKSEDDSIQCDQSKVPGRRTSNGGINYKFSSMPVLEDGLSSGHNSDVEVENSEQVPLINDHKKHLKNVSDSPQQGINKVNSNTGSMPVTRSPISTQLKTRQMSNALESPQLWVKKVVNSDYDHEGLGFFRSRDATPPPPAPHAHRPAHSINVSRTATLISPGPDTPSTPSSSMSQKIGEQRISPDLNLHELKEAIQVTRQTRKIVTLPVPNSSQRSSSPIWVPRPTNDCRPHASSASNRGISHLDKGNEDEGEKETDQLLTDIHRDDRGFFDDKDENLSQSKKKSRNKEVIVHEPAVLIEGVLFRANYLGSTQIVCEGQPTKYTRMMQAEEAVSRIKAPEGETQPSTEVDLFISTEKIMVLNTELKEIMMDHALRTISYIADIGDLVVLMARRRMIPQEGEDSGSKIAKTPKMICHVFESEEAQFIAQSIGQAFQVAYMEFLKANGIEDQSFVREMDYQEVLNSQEIFGDELQMFAKKELQKEVIVPKARNEMLGVVIVESGWGSMLPTVVIANLAPAGAAARCGQLNIGDQIIAINGVSLVGLPLSTCQTYIKNAKSATVVKLTVVPCPPVVEVKIKRPDTKYQLGFSVQNGVICSLLRGGIAERGGVRVGHRIIEINGQSVVAVPHERIVGLLATSVGEINMKTMPTSMFRLLTGQETPVYI